MEAATVSTRGLKLWEIVGELDEIGEAIAEAGGELTPELGARLDAMEGALEEKVERIALFVRECEANAEAAKLEKDRLARIEKHFATKASGLKGYLQFFMRRAGQTRVKTPKVRVWEQKNGRPSISYSGDPSKLPDNLKTVTVAPDTAAAYELVKAGAKLPEGWAVEHGHHLRIG